MSQDGSGSSGGAVLLKDLEDKITTMEKQNFDLKMQLFYLNEKVASSAASEVDSSPYSPQPSRSNNTINNNNNNNNSGSSSSSGAGSSGSSSTISSAVEVANLRRISELESEVMQLKALTRQQQTLENLNSSSMRQQQLQQQGVFGSSQIEENRRRERTTMQAIADHDAQLIARLEEEVVSLRAQLESEKTLVTSCADKVSGLLAELNEKDKLLLIQGENNKILIAQNETLSDRVRRQDLILLKKSIQLGDGNIGVGEGNDEPFSESVLDPSMPLRSNIYSAALSVSNKSASGSSSSSSGGGGGSTSSLQNAAAAVKSALEASSRDGGQEVTSKDFLDFGAQAAWEELHMLRKENSSLKKQVETERALQATQEEALTRIKKSAEEITILEAEEIARLELELDRSLDDKEKWQRKCKTAEAMADQYRLQLDELDRRLREEDQLGEEVERAYSNSATPYRSFRDPTFASSSSYAAPPYSLKRQQQQQQQQQQQGQFSSSAPLSPRRSVLAVGPSSSSSSSGGGGGARSSSGGGKAPVPVSRGRSAVKQQTTGLMGPAFNPRRAVSGSPPRNRTILERQQQQQQQQQQRKQQRSRSPAATPIDSARRNISMSMPLTSNSSNSAINNAPPMSIRDYVNGRGGGGGGVGVGATMDSFSSPRVLPPPPPPAPFARGNGGGGGGVGVGGAPAAASSSDDEKRVVEMFRAREQELLQALEGVVRRVHELEKERS